MQTPISTSCLQAFHTSVWGVKTVQSADQQRNSLKNVGGNPSNSFEQLLGQVERQMDKKLDRYSSL